CRLRGRSAGPACRERQESRSNLVSIKQTYRTGGAMNTLTATRAVFIGLAMLATPLGGETHPQEQVPGLVVLATPGQRPDRPRMAPSPAEGDEARKKRTIDALGSLPLGFERNRGQTDPQVKFLARRQRGILFF